MNQSLAKFAAVLEKQINIIKYTLHCFTFIEWVSKFHFGIPHIQYSAIGTLVDREVVVLVYPSDRARVFQFSIAKLQRLMLNFLIGMSFQSSGRHLMQTLFHPILVVCFAIEVKKKKCHFTALWSRKQNY